MADGAHGSTRARSSDGVVVSMLPADATRGRIPHPLDVGRHVHGDPLTSLPADLAAALSALDNPGRFFAGIGNALWMSAALVATMASLVLLVVSMG